MYKKIIILFFGLLLVIVACMRPPVEPQSGTPSLELQLDFTDALKKTSEIVNVPVFDLEYDVNAVPAFLDGSDFNHDVSLSNIEPNPVINRGVTASFAQNSYIQVFDSYYRFNGTRGIKISVTLYVFDEGLSNQVIVEKVDNLGLGYRMGLQNNVPYFRLNVNETTAYILRAQTPLLPNTWYTLTASYSPGPPFLTLTNQQDTTFTIEEPMPITGSNPLVIGNSYYNSGLGLSGMISDVVINANLEFESFDLVRVSVMDANNMLKNDSLRNMNSLQIMNYFNSYQAYEDSTGWYDVTEDLYHLHYDTTAQRDGFQWSDFRDVWDRHFTILSEQNLIVKNGFAQGVVDGVPGLNIVAVGALRDDRMIYYGYGFALGVKDRNVPIHISMGTVE